MPPCPRDLSGGTDERGEFALFAAQENLAESAKAASVAQAMPRLSAFAQVGYGVPALNMLSSDPASFWVIGFRANWALDAFYTLPLKSTYQAQTELLVSEYTIQVIKRLALFSISYETIYQYLLYDKKKGGALYKHLRFVPKRRRKRYNSHDSRGRLDGKSYISERPAYINNRSEVGHWEGDTVIGRDQSAN